MAVREVRAAGHEALMLVTELLQRVRRTDPQAGLWEAADMHWLWRKPRQSDDIDQLFWLDDHGPVAGVFLSSWTGAAWQCDPIVVPHVSGPDPEVVWQRALDHAAVHAETGLEVPVSDDDPVFTTLAGRSGLVVGERSSVAWMDVSDRPDVRALPDGFVLVDRTQRQGTPHPMRHRNGESVAERLGQCSLYNPALDLAVETADGEVVAYSLYWFDPVTKVGLVEPVRVEDAFQRQGLAKAMLTAGLERLAAQGAHRAKIGFESDAAGALYQSIGFQPTSTATWYRTR